MFVGKQNFEHLTTLCDDNHLTCNGIAKQFKIVEYIKNRTVHLTILHSLTNIGLRGHFVLYFVTFLSALYKLKENDGLAAAYRPPNFASSMISSSDITWKSSAFKVHTLLTM